MDGSFFNIYGGSNQFYKSEEMEKHQFYPPLSQSSRETTIYSFKFPQNKHYYHFPINIPKYFNVITLEKKRQTAVFSFKSVPLHQKQKAFINY